MRRGQFEGLVQLQGDRYYFYVRDLTREQPAIHGFGVDRREAVAAVEQLLDLLERDARRKSIRRWLERADAVSRDKVDEGERRDDDMAWLKKAA